MKVLVTWASIFLLIVTSALLYKRVTAPNGVGSPSPSPYTVTINPGDFTTTIDHPLFSLPAGRKMVYESKTEDGIERTEIEVTSETRSVMGVTTTTYRDRVFLGNVLVEDTRDYLAQDKDGNVWYFGEDVDNYEDGTLQDHKGSWIAGVDGALPGIWIKVNPQIGDRYKQEYLASEAEDVSDIVAVGETVTTQTKVYTGCVKTYDWTPLDGNSREHKYYCPEPQALVLVEDLTDGSRTELVSVSQ